MKQPEPHTDPFHVIEWRLKANYPQRNYPNWQPIEDWDSEAEAQERLKYWQGLSLAQIVEFRVNKV